MASFAVLNAEQCEASHEERFDGCSDIAHGKKT